MTKQQIARMRAALEKVDAAAKEIRTIATECCEQEHFDAMETAVQLQHQVDINRDWMNREEEAHKAIDDVLENNP